MKFILVNHRTPLNTACCSECAQSLGTGYLREVSSQRQYCDYDCYVRGETRTLFMPWLAVTRGDNAPAASGPALPYTASVELLTSFAAATCWYSISLAKAAVRVGELIATEGFGPFSGRR